MKVVESKWSSAWMIVRNEWGDERYDGSGRPYRYEPLPLARVPEGHNRTSAEAKALAERIATLLSLDMGEGGPEGLEALAFELMGRAQEMRLKRDPAGEFQRNLVSMSTPHENSEGPDVPARE